MDKNQLAAALAAFSQNGGKVQQVEEGARAIDPAIRYCRCGCEGNWTDHTMRLGESGSRAGY